MRGFTALAIGLFSALAASAAEVEIVNNQPFAIKMPVYVRSLESGGQRVAIFADVAAGKTQKLSVGQKPDAPAIALSKADDGITLGQYGKLTWGVVVHPADPDARKVDPPPSTKADFAAIFKPLAMNFAKHSEGVWQADGAAEGLTVAVEIRSLAGGFIDLDAKVTNASAPTQNVYAAVICRWEQPAGAKRSLDYDNHLLNLDDGTWSPFRAGSDRSLYVQRGVDWINTRLPNANIEWMNDFTPSFTFHKKATAKTPAHWAGANTAQLAQEAQAAAGSVYSITEIARPNNKSYRSRLEDNVLPPVGASETISSRMIVDASPVDDAVADRRFIAYTGYNPQELQPNGDVRISFGVSSVRFGTSYLPYSTLGENFITQRQPGMSTEGYWPLAPETVKHWNLFADDMKRDLRILKSLGFDLVRLHHLELIYNKDKNGAEVIDVATRNAYLDFLFGQMKSLRLKALLDVKLTPEQTADLVSRYREQIDGVEIDNEVLLMMGVPDADEAYWKAVYAAVKKVAPEVPVHLTAHTNTGAFNQLLKDGIPFDKVGEHAYLDSLDAIPSARDYALAAGNYAAKIGKEATITEWNWRFLTHMTFDARAKIYPPIFENILATRSIPTVYQFQFQDSLAINPATLRGMRRYELLLLSRRPKPEAIEFENLIDKYGAATAPHRLLGIERRVVDFKDRQATATFELRNNSDKPMKLTATAEGPAALDASVAMDVSIEPHGTASVPMTLNLPKNAQSGFYHAFLRLEGPDGFLRYGWVEAHQMGALKIDKAPAAGVTYGPGALDFNFNRPLAVVYANDAAPTDVEAAWTLFITLESATGRPVEIYEAKDLPKDNKAAVILVETKKEKSPTVRLEGDSLLVTGANPKELLSASMDLTLRYWKYAKDSAIPRVGLTKERVENRG